jgi:hypothetical protein
MMMAGGVTGGASGKGVDKVGEVGDRASEGLAFNSCYPPDTVLVLTTDNSLSLFPPSHTFFLFLPLGTLTRNCHMTPSVLCFHKHSSSSFP